MYVGIPPDLMSKLALVLTGKIIATVAVWSGPLLLLPTETLVTLGVPDLSVPFARLLGWAYLSLCVGYAFGLRSELAGQRPIAAIWLGIVSNLGASAYLFYFGLLGTWRAMPELVQIIAWSSALVAALISIGLIWFGLLRWQSPKRIMT